MGTFEVKFTFKGHYEKLQDYLIDWYVRRGMDCTAYTASDGTGGADVDKKYLAAFCMIDKLCVTSVKWDKDGVTAWRPKRRKTMKSSNGRASLQMRQKVNTK